MKKSNQVSSPKAEDLMIGNLLLNEYDEIIEVTFDVLKHIDLYNIAKKEGVDVGKLQYKPIMITGELLVDLGVITKESSKQNISLFAKGVVLHQIYQGYNFCINGHLISRVEYVHQVQNLWFFVTTKKLTLKQ